MKCRHCETELKKVFIDLGEMPPSNSYLDNPEQKENIYPLKVFVCHECFLVQTEDYVEKEEMFSNNYAYFSSQSKTFLKHAKDYVDMITDRLDLNKTSKVLEIACNDGYLLQYFVEKEIPCLGIEPTLSTATEARKKEIPILCSFFSEGLSEEIKQKAGTFDLVIGNNVLAHVPELNDFLKGVRNILSDSGVVTFEFPYLLNLIEKKQFDTIYHEHFSYFSVTALDRIFKSNGLEIYDIEEIPTHGGSLRVYAKRNDTYFLVRNAVYEFLKREEEIGLSDISYYEGFQKYIEKIKFEFILFTDMCKHSKAKIVGYGAAAKANTFLNYMKVNNSVIPFVIDTTPAKQGKLLPGSKIPVISEEIFKEIDPDYVIIFPWNFKDEIIERLRSKVSEDCKFVTFIPSLELTK
jgi:2-polyprenyl-3-methyl-5-hydroxy-6-metoxy-1,4-benzoquinol methylase